MTTGPIDHADWVRRLLDEHEHNLVRYAARLLGDLERARDVVQDTFLKLIRQDRAEVEDHAAEWLFTVCRNRSLDVLRKERRMKGMSEQQERSLSRRADPAQDTLASSDHQEVIELIEQLPQRQQEVIRLKFQGGLSYREISRVTELSVSNVGFLIHTGLKAVREKLAGKSRAEVNPGAGIAR